MLMKNILLTLLFLPLINFSQNINIGGSSSQSNGKQLLSSGIGNYVESHYKARQTNIDLSLSKGFRLPIGYYIIRIGAEYSINSINYDFSQTSPEYTNFKSKGNSIMPYSEIACRLFQLSDIFYTYASFGTMINLENLSYKYDNNIFPQNELDYNYVLPFFSFGAVIRTNLFSVVPFVKYQLDPIYFETLNELNSYDLNELISNSGIVTGLNFSFAL